MSGNVIINAKPIRKQDYLTIINNLKAVLPSGLHIYPFGSAGKKEISGDVDLFIDAADLLQLFPSSTLANSKKLLQQYFIDKGLDSKLCGANVHVGIPLNDDIVQLDLTPVYNASDIAYLHDHVYDNSSVSGKTIVSIWCDLANLTSDNLMISPYKGLLTRDTKELISNDPFEIAKLIIGPNATEYDMRSPSRLLRATSTLSDLTKHTHINNTYIL